jgi:hypothetical protein
VGSSRSQSEIVRVLGGDPEARGRGNKETLYLLDTIIFQVAVMQVHSHGREEKSFSSHSERR